MWSVWMIVVLLPGFVRGDDVIGGLVSDYFKRLYVRQIVAFGCWSPQESVEFSRFLTKADRSLTYVFIRDGLDMERILKVNYYKLGVLLDLDCPQSDRIFDQFQRQHLRHNESYFWLMSTRRDRVPEYFDKLPLNIATEMTVAMGSWNVNNGLNVVLTQYKYKRRGNLYGLVLNASIAIDHPPVPNYETNTLDTHPASETALIAAAAMCQQGLSDGPRCYSGRIAFLSLFLWGLLLFQYYSASVVGSLLSKKPNWITTLADLADSNHLYVSCYQTTTDPVAKELYQKKVAVNKRRTQEPYYTAEQGIKLVKNGGFAFHVDVATAYKFIEETFDDDEICDLVEIQLFPPKHTATGTAKHSRFYISLRQVVEHALSRRLLNTWMHRRPRCPETHKAKPIPVILTEFSPALLLLSGGVLFATTVMFIEMCHQRRKNPSIQMSRPATDSTAEPEDNTIIFNE